MECSSVEKVPKGETMECYSCGEVRTEGQEFLCVNNTGNFCSISCAKDWD